MKVFPVNRVREIDAYTIEHEPVSSVDLMERAAVACTRWLQSFVSYRSEVWVFAGPGNNGGDGLAVARLMSGCSFRVKVFIPRFSGKFSADFSQNLKRLTDETKVPVSWIEEESSFPVPGNGVVVIDALFGSGLTRPAEGFPAALIHHINEHSSCTVSIDIPSGLFGEDNRKNNPDHIIHASHTLTFQFPKLSFFFSSNYIFTGQWYILPIGLHEEFIDSLPAQHFYVTEKEVAGFVKKRLPFSHKGTYGHGLLIAGSHGMMGAAVLASKAALRAGAGLITSHIPARSDMIMQIAVPEAIISFDHSSKVFSSVPGLEKYSAVAVGPGIGRRPETADALSQLFGKFDKPMVIDADALNLISEDASLFAKIPAGSILTPHPREFERVFGPCADPYERYLKAQSAAIEHNLFIVLKGAYTMLACPDGTCWFNSTGNPGMATGGSGDVLTGLLLGLLAQGYPPKDAALLGVYIHGLAGDLAAGTLGVHALIAGDIVSQIGPAMKRLEADGR